jgi:small-conductance mechanosensitive channel
MKLIVAACIVLALIISIKVSSLLLNKIGVGKAVSMYRLKYITKTIHIALLFLYSVILITFLSIEYSQVLIFLSSIFAVLGVALFAQWSILSNITASLIIFFGFPYRVGDYVKIIDKEADVSGIIEEISLFHVIIKNGDEQVSYPNTLLLQKPVLQNVSLNKSNQLDV